MRRLDMEYMGAGKVKSSLDKQHAGLRELRNEKDLSDLVLPFAAVDARRPGVVEETKRLIEEDGFRGIKLYPPLGYHPNDPLLRPLYSFAAERGIPVMTHCSRPAGVKFRGEVTERMRTDPVTGERLDLGREQLLTRFTDPDSYVPILEAPQSGRPLTPWRQWRQGVHCIPRSRLVTGSKRPQRGVRKRRQPAPAVWRAAGSVCP